MLIKVDLKGVTLSRIFIFYYYYYYYYLSESTRGTNNKTMFFSPYIYVYIYICTADFSVLVDMPWIEQRLSTFFVNFSRDSP